jgi:two-component SAPR family response regulator
MYLVSRPNQTATREQVLDDLWPDQDPASGINSLHQTLHFLRRDIVPAHELATAVDYVVLESELVYLDPNLVQIDSVSFHRQALELLSSDQIIGAGSRLASEYRGHFAPEFEYEEWSSSWRDRVHTTYLHLVQAVADSLVRSGMPRQASEVLERALLVDPAATELEPLLVRALWALGARAAAREQYEHYASAYRSDYGIDADPLETILSEILEGPSA